MANPYRGEIDLEALGERFKLRLDIDAICEVESETDLGFGDILSRVLGRGVNLRIARAILRSASDGKIDRDKANAILGPDHIVSLWPQMVRLVSLCLPPASEVGDANPPVAAGAPPGNGKDS